METAHRPAPVADDLALVDGYRRYLGVAPGGVDLAASLAELPLDHVERLRVALAALPAGGRVLVFGNGGSFDNARLIASRLRAHGIAAKTPGDPDDYLAVALRDGYARIFADGLARDGVGQRDIALGISGSGNSANVVDALALARARGAQAFCLGGRDGGRMRLVCGDERSLIARSQCMEAIEDLHVAMVSIALDAHARGVAVAPAADAFRARFAAFCDEANVRALAALGAGMLRAMARRGHVFVLGVGIGANHFRADMGRGATNALPIRGLSTPEVFTLNSAQATANDDGLDFVLADGLVKFEPGADDCAVLVDLPGTERMLAHCAALLVGNGVETHALGARGIRLDAFAPYDAEIGVALVGHACGEVIRAHLAARWRARRIAARPAFPPGQKKLGPSETDRFEAELRRAGELADDEVLTFCYGACFAVRAPIGQREPRCHY